MSKPMISHLSKYYQTIISRFNITDIEPPRTNRHSHENDMLNGFGTIIYNVKQRGFYGIIDDNGNKYFPINGKQFFSLHSDRKHIQFSVRLYPDICNVYHWGKTVELIALQIVD